MNLVVALPNREELRRFVKETLCDYDRLDPVQTPFFEALLTRGGRPCGLFFEVQGPRLVRSRAIWVGDEHRLLFYNSTGTRFAEFMLSEAPELQPLRSDRFPRIAVA